MKCSCCGKAKKLFESFEKLDKNVSICVECSKELYKYQDSKHDKNEVAAAKILGKIKKEGNSPEFTKWLGTFVSRFEPNKADLAGSEEFETTSDN